MEASKLFALGYLSPDDLVLLQLVNRRFHSLITTHRTLLPRRVLKMAYRWYSCGRLSRGIWGLWDLCQSYSTHPSPSIEQRLLAGEKCWGLDRKWTAGGYRHRRVECDCEEGWEMLQQLLGDASKSSVADFDIQSFPVDAQPVEMHQWMEFRAMGRVMGGLGGGLFLKM